ncbi:hypothetical protein HBB16_15165 [Pseudonocardia sp. MCCB 268]|nr:hypothetical protein [Pseudonocardia cytotoxica]
MANGSDVEFPPRSPGTKRGARGSSGSAPRAVAVGMATFVLVYSVQGLLPRLSAEFGISSSAASLVLSRRPGPSPWRSPPAVPRSPRPGGRAVMTWALAASAVAGTARPARPASPHSS